MCSPLILSVDGTSGPALLAMEALVRTTYTLHSPTLPLNLASLTPSFIVGALHLAVTAPEAGSGRLYVGKTTGANCHRRHEMPQRRGDDRGA